MEEAEKKKQAEAAKEYVKNFNKYVDETEEIIPDTKIPKNLKKEIVNGLTKPVSYDEANRPLDIIGDFMNKGGYEARFKMAYILKLTEGFTKMENISAKTAEKKAVKSLDRLLRTKPTSTGFTSDESDQYVGSIEDDLKEFDEFLG